MKYITICYKRYLLVIVCLSKYLLRRQERLTNLLPHTKDLKLFDNGVEVKLVSKPNSQSIRVALNHVRLCPAEIAVTDCDKPEEYIVTSETKNLESKENPSDSNDLKRQGL